MQTGFHTYGTSAYGRSLTRQINANRPSLSFEGNKPEDKPASTTPPKPGKPKRHLLRWFLAAMAVGTGSYGYYLSTQVPVMHSTTFNASLSSNDYQRKSATEKQALLWQTVSANPYGAALPPTNSAGALSGNGLGVLNNLVKIFDGSYMKNTFDQTSDVRPPHSKLFHPFGSVAKVDIVVHPGHPYTGMFAQNSVGIARLSLAANDSPSLYAPGIALKLFVDGKPSVNIMAIPGLAPQSSRDFFARTPSTIFPIGGGAAGSLVNKIITTGAQVTRANELHVNHFAAVGPNGQAVESPVTPFQLEFRPSQAHFATDSKADFRTDMEAIPTGTVIYEIWGKQTADDTEMVHIADVKTASPFVASQFADQELYFQHPREGISAAK